MCQDGAREVQTKVLDKIKSDKLKVYVVWTPCLKGDTRTEATSSMKFVRDKRASHFWDSRRRLGVQYGKTLDLPRKRTFAWDVYLAFDAKTKWEKRPPPPADWMHQLGRDKRRLDGDKLRKSVQKLLRDVK